MRNDTLTGVAGIDAELSGGRGHDLHDFDASAGRTDIIRLLLSSAASRGKEWRHPDG